MRLMLSAIVAIATLSGVTMAHAQALSIEEERLLQLINQVRGDAGLQPVVADVQICRVARSHSTDMGDSRFFSHISPRTGSPGDRLRAAGVEFRLSGENIALDQSVDGAHRAFMTSPGHRRNVLDADFSVVGIGIVSTGRGLYVTQHFIRPRPGFVASVPPSSHGRRPASAADRPRHTETVPSPRSCVHCDVSAHGAGRVAGAAEATTPPPVYVPAPAAPVYTPAPVYAPPVYAPAPAPAQPTVIWMATPGGGWQLVPAPW